ncbi:MAG: hypothetical protein M3N45_00755 [Actinomycetota bacterium]|nr:hypothetical protein [Actinomycetota bacterium]
MEDTRVISVRLPKEVYLRLRRYSEQYAGIPPSTLIRSWTIQALRELEPLMRQQPMPGFERLPRPQEPPKLPQSGSGGGERSGRAERRKQKNRANRKRKK